MSAPFMQLYIADYLGDTQHLTTEQHGAYLLLLMAMWRAGGRLPNDPAKLARIARVSARRWHIVGAEVMPFFEVEGDQITQKRLEREHQKALSISEKRSVAGKAGNSAKSLKTNEPSPAIADQLPDHTYAGFQISERSKEGSNSETNVSGAAAPSKADLEKELFTRGREVLGKSAGGVIAKLLKHHQGNTALARSDIERASTKASPAEWVGAVLRNGAKTAAPADDGPETSYETMRAYWARGGWLPGWGPRPDMGGCRVPPEILKQWRADLTTTRAA